MTIKVQSLIDRLKERLGALLAIGGGSVIDAAKAAGAGIASGSDVEALARGAPILQEGPPSWLYRPPRGAGARSPPMPPLRSAIG